ncbi:protein regulator of cytokinesis 1 [Drosophila ficusphila]|uniref:protein regulator of cytokinesis 1 n=1 Tax=Drosophila ficusphila TaxID=30025 RepID=UPI0007E84672|nr:protein regulator of cytokinesis 1 [Drosophila ficusphila]
MIFTEHKAKILAMTAAHTDELHAMWSRMFEPQTCEDCLVRLMDHSNNFYTDLLKESREKEQGIISEIASLRTEAIDLTRLLHESVDMDALIQPDDMPLVIWQLKLDKSVDHLREEVARRRAEITELLLQQEQLCEELGELPQPLLADTLPLPEEMVAFRDRLEQLRHQRVQRRKEMDQLRLEIKEDMKRLELHVQTDTGKRFLNQENPCLRPESFERLRLMRQEYADQVQELRNQIDEMRGKVDLLWERLKLTDEFAKRRVRESTSYTQRTYDILREELQRCQAMRRQNLKAFIEQLRIEINEWWDLTLKSTEERRRFNSYFSDPESEDVLELLEMELDELKNFYNSNKKIFELYANRTELWSRMEALEAKANDPNRFNNRGGQLLKEEKERKAMTTRLPKIDQQITELVKSYMAHANTPFLVNGEDILESMSADWEHHRQSKKQPSAHKNYPTITASKMKPPSVPLTPNTLKSNKAMNGSSSSLKKSPSKMHATSEAKSTGNLQKRRHPTNGKTSPKPVAAAKRNLISSLECNNSGPVLGVNGQKLLKSPQKKVRVLEYSVRRGKPTGRPSTGSRNNRRIPPIPQVRVQPPSSEENESEDSEEPETQTSVEAYPNHI